LPSQRQHSGSAASRLHWSQVHSYALPLLIMSAVRNCC